MDKNYYDVIVVGTGVAGLYTCLTLAKDKKILLLTKDEVLNCDSYLAQGGICTLLDEKDYPLYFEDTMKAGRFENDLIAVHDMITQSKEIINDLIDKGVDFDKNTDGSLNYTREGGHSKFRILHHKDVTGKEITSKLYERVKELDNITIKEHTLVMD
ncbi:MAG: FAD-dependent oxidoreductase, partial [Clostridia bacterium]|nr:FAD-dependent oxidoreductase [Clostridia bacterium]